MKTIWNLGARTFIDPFGRDMPNSDITVQYDTIQITFVQCNDLDKWMIDVSSVPYGRSFGWKRKNRERTAAKRP